MLSDAIYLKYHRYLFPDRKLLYSFPSDAYQDMSSKSPILGKITFCYKTGRETYTIEYLMKEYYMQKNVEDKRRKESYTIRPNRCLSDLVVIPYQ